MSIDLTLDRIRRLASHLPPYTRPTCHIAGTNGKGSVAALVSSMLATSLSVGRFNSPHLVSLNDSIAINNESVSLATYNTTRSEIVEADQEHGTNLSGFEILTLTALLIFERAKVDVVVLEVGLGGRLDATNIIPDECVLVSALTAVDLDHQAFLGNTVSAIAAEKAAIARSGRPFVMGTQMHVEVEGVVDKVVTAAGAMMLYALPVFPRDWDPSIDGPQPAPFTLSSKETHPPVPVRFAMPCFDHPIRALLPLHGEHQLDNLALAVSIVSAAITSSELTPHRSRFTDQSIAQGIKNARWPGRLSFHTFALAAESLPILVLADGAHNPASAATLGAYLSGFLAPLPKPISLTYILGVSQAPKKTPAETLGPLLASLDGVDVGAAFVNFSQPEGMPWVHAVPPVELKEAMKLLRPEITTYLDEGGLRGALEWAMQRNGTGSGLVVVAGSLYLVADFYRLLEGKK
ncbi:Mur ligase [Mycena kentingensis (nom. inval.)]|nr:Mur ligase [Mycena kentingensis (nom. inval.)]